MKHRTRIFSTSLAFATTLSVVPAQAALQETYVSGHGNDSNACTLNAPCRTFAHAITQTAGHGTIVVLDSAKYGGVTIKKSISIVNDGVGTASILVPAKGTGITVNFGNYNGVATLRGLTIEGGNVGTKGIAFTGTGTLNVLDCTVRNMKERGISLTPSAGGLVVINKTTVTNSHIGIFERGNAAGNSFTLTLSHVKLTNNGFFTNGYGFFLTHEGIVAIDSSLIAENGTGLALHKDSSNYSENAFVIGSKIVNNRNSINVDINTILTLEKTSVATSTSSGITNNGAIQSFGDNAILDTVTGNAMFSFSLQ